MHVDTILPKNYIKDIDFSSNWSIGSGENSQAYRTLNCVNGKIASINEKESKTLIMFILESLDSRTMLSFGKYVMRF